MQVKRTTILPNILKYTYLCLIPLSGTQVDKNDLMLEIRALMTAWTISADHLYLNPRQNLCNKSIFILFIMYALQYAKHP